MRRNETLFVAFAALALATSCSQEDLTSQSNLSNNEISINASMGLKSRATETTTANLSSIYVSAFISNQANYMSQVNYTKSESTWSTAAGTFFWPATETLNFYAYAPEITTSTENTGTVTIGKDNQKVTGFTPYADASANSKADAAKQVDFIYATAKGSANSTTEGEANATSGVTLTFKHALSQIIVQAKNSNSAYQVEVSGVKLGNVYGKGDFTFGTTSDNASWTTSGEKTTVYTTEHNAVTLTSDAANVDNNQAFMLIPQQLVKGNNSKASAGSYLALKVKITMKSGDNTYDGQKYYEGYAYVGLDTKWEMGKKYTYIVDFSKGAGQKEDGSNIFGNEIKIATVTVTEWTAESNKDVALDNTAATN